MRLQNNSPLPAAPQPQGAQDRLMTEADLADRWKVPKKTLRNWRCLKKGPPWIQIGAGHIRYRPADIEAYETSKVVLGVGQ
jgi:hypothetical protein